MLFNSAVFIFLFLPVTLFIYLWLRTHDRYRISLAWLVLASLFFYGWWNPQYVLLMIISIAVNYGIGVLLDKHGSHRFFTLCTGILFNLGLLAYFKYTDFVVVSLNAYTAGHWDLPHIILPLAISFVTFQQIAYIVDAYRRKDRAKDALRYCLFVTFFPQLIAGPIVHHNEMIPQFVHYLSRRTLWVNIAIGLSIFAIGLFKKMVLADGVALYATPVFDAATQGYVLTFFEAWTGALAYTLQIYFDFSGYCDMAIGLARMFGIQLPVNFASPYKAKNIIDFWRRWHITLSRFLRDYLYFPLGGGRKGNMRRYSNLLIVMFLGGIWHGAGWTFIVWGLLHGMYLLINHAWRDALAWLDIKLTRRWSIYIADVLSRCLTLLVVVVAWVFFRADNLDAAQSILESMCGMHGLSLLGSLQGLLSVQQIAWLEAYGVSFTGMFYNGLANFNVGIIWIAVLMICTQILPNTQTVMRKYKAGLSDMSRHIQEKPGVIGWRINMLSGMIVGILLFFSFSKWFAATPSEFIYFNF